MPRYSLYFQNDYGPNGVQLVAESDDLQKLIVMAEEGDWGIAAWIETPDGSEIWDYEIAHPPLEDV